MKHETHSQYDPRQSALAERAFLTVWSGLGRWHDQLVLVGGLVPKFICRAPPASPDDLPRPVTLDVDLGIALGTDSGQYGTISTELRGQGFQRNAKQTYRYEKTIGSFTVPVDFMVEYPPNTEGIVAVDDIAAGVMPGIGRALQTARTLEIRGQDLHGADQVVQARVCEVGPFLALKLRAFLNRQQPKDAYDILYTVLHYDGGTEAAIAAFAEEVRVGNLACPDALRCLRTLFANERAPGPVKASHFVLGDITPDESDDSRHWRTTIRQDMVDAANRLLQSATNHPL